jgi:hypothetical protein
MLKTGMLGPYRLDVDGIGKAVRRRGPGTYVLGYEDFNNTFFVNYVGRSDKDLAEDLKSRIGSDILFKFVLYSTPREAFLKQCELFHSFSPRANVLHPARLEGTNWKCPSCGGK